MEALGAAASIISVLNLTKTVSKYLIEVAESSKQSQKALLEISAARGILHQLHDITKDFQSEYEWNIVFKQLLVQNGPLDQLKVTLQKFEVKLKPATGLKKLGKGLIWPFTKSELGELLSAINWQKSLITLALQKDSV